MDSRFVMSASNASNNAEPTPQAEPQRESATSVAEARAPQRTTPQQLPQFRVLLHNDDVNPMDAVVETIVGLTPLTFESAVEAMLEAHESGVALLLVTHQERAELYQEQFQSKKLVVTIEPVE